MAKYKVGDKVRVRSDLKQHVCYQMENNYSSNVAGIEMLKFRGKIITISSFDHGQYHVDECSDWYWTDEMFEGLAEAEQEFNVFDTVKHEKYGIGTITKYSIVSINEFKKTLIEVDFDEWNEDFIPGSNKTNVKAQDLTLIKAYLPN